MITAAMRAAHRCSVSASAATAENRSGSGRTTGRAPSTGSSGVLDDVVGEQRDRGQAAGERQLREGGGQRHPGGDADRALQRRGDDAGQAVRLGDAQRGPHPTQRLHLEDDDVAGLAQVDRERVGRAAHALVDGDPDVDPPAQRGQLGQRGARLLDVLQPHGGVQRADAGDRGVHVPGRVGVDPDRARRPEGVAHRLHAGEVVGLGLPRLGHLHLGRAAAGRGDDGVRPLGVHRRHRDVHRDGVRSGAGQPTVAASTAAAHQRRLSAMS